MINDINVNIGAVIFLEISKERFHQWHKYGFGGLLTRFLRDQGVEEEALVYRLAVDTLPMDVSRTKGIIMSHGLELAMLEYQARDDMITAWMYGLQLLLL